MKSRTISRLYESWLGVPVVLLYRQLPDIIRDTLEGPQAGASSDWARHRKMWKVRPDKLDDAKALMALIGAELERMPDHDGDGGILLAFEPETDLLVITQVGYMNLALVTAILEAKKAPSTGEKTG